MVKRIISSVLHHFLVIFANFPHVSPSDGVVMLHDAVNMQELSLDAQGRFFAKVRDRSDVQDLGGTLHEVRELHDVVLDYWVVGVVARPVCIVSL